MTAQLKKTPKQTAAIDLIGSCETSLIEGGVIAEVTIRCQNRDDESLLFRYNLFRNV